ncbi:mitochondrial 37S ribosomal protein NAM9 [Schizosaccharomyces japonicus yFS275]|uniref:Ribosomal protein subunit S4 n=1 Tax=Schizosaccharomyces japonicus (strain yFS275 / FY16936) TaxID=402676 RepID=B6JWW4_SCHJY|nr:mitochondrial 37S ribosomal protein NAM9 [Schizosaccharomyces japonicus yFS275]EEB05865.1 ribosomal protein subunit S4 [Schizosaccharomyces japonicus yFS275]
MVKKPKFSLSRQLLRPSWNKYNAFNFACKKLPNLNGKTLFQKKWIAKRETRSFHGPHLREYQFKNYFESKLLGMTSVNSPAENSKIPFMSQLYAPLESRLDIALHRAMFASSVEQAHKIIVSNKVSVNGIREKRAHLRLEPGDVVTVDPATVMRSVSSFKPTKSSASSAEATQDAQDTRDEKAVKAQTNKAWLEMGVEKFIPKPFMCVFAFIPSYLEVCFRTCSFVYVRHPIARANMSEVPSPFPERFHALAYNYYIRFRAMRQSLKKHQAKHMIPQRIHDPKFYRGPRSLYRNAAVSPSTPLPSDF